MPQRTPDHLNDQDWAFALSRNPHMTASLLIEAFKQHAIDIEDGNLSPLPCTNTRTNEAGRDVDAYPRTAWMRGASSQTLGVRFTEDETPWAVRLCPWQHLVIANKALSLRIVERHRERISR